jgi:hypothetical protein
LARTVPIVSIRENGVSSPTSVAASSRMVVFNQESYETAPAREQ